MLTSVLCVCVVTNILHEGLHIVSFYLGCCTSNYNLPATLSPGEGIFPGLEAPGDAFEIGHGSFQPAWSAGWCSAQRINNPMIAGGNHTLIQMPPALRSFCFILLPILPVCQSRNVVDGYTVILCKGDHMVERDFTVTPFIEGILLCGHFQKLCNMSLFQVSIFPQIPKSLVMVHKLRHLHLFIQTNIIIQTNESLTFSFISMRITVCSSI